MNGYVDFKLPPLSFSEFLRLIGNDHLSTISSFNDLLTFAPQQITEERRQLFETFLCLGGFPESAMQYKKRLEANQIQNYIAQSVIRKIITKDLRKYFNLKKSAEDLKLFKLLCFESGNVINISRLAKEISFTNHTLKKRLQALESASLVLSIYRFDTKIRRTIDTHPKIYISPSIAMSYLGYEKIPPGSIIGHLVEGYVPERLRYWLPNPSEEIYYVALTRNKELNFFIPNKKVLIESKYTEHISIQTIDELIASTSPYSVKPILITRNYTQDLRLKNIPACFL